MANRDSQASAVKTPIEPGLIARVAAGVRYALTGNAPDWFGPQQPLLPVAPPEVAGRQFDYAIGYNQRLTPRMEEAVSFGQMRALADAYDVLRLVIETRKDQVAKLKWKIVPKDESKQPDDRCKDITAFLQQPDKDHDWDDWLRMLLEDLFVIDAPTIYPRLTNGGQLYALEPVDGATIKRVLDDTGRTPVAPQPAYQQILKGLPAVDYSRDELIYKPRNVRTHKVYGYSPVEQIIVTVNLALRRQANQLSYYTEGNTPNLIFQVPKDWNPDQIAKFQKWWDLLCSGESKHHARFVPEGVAPINTKPEKLFDEAEEWLAKVVCYAFSVSHQWAAKQMNRATAETAHQQALEEGLAPIQNWVRSLINRVIVQYFGALDLEFQWDEEEEQDPEVQNDILDKRVRNGSITLDQYRATLGDEPLPNGLGAVPMIYTAAGAVLIDTIINPPPPPPPPVIVAPGHEPGAPGSSSDDGSTTPPNDKQPPADGNAAKIEKKKRAQLL